MANKRRGEVDIVLDEQTYRLCLTLGALAELEAAFGEDDMLALANRFEDGRLRSEDVVRIIGAGLRGAGYDLSDADVARMHCAGGATGFVVAVAELLRVTFGGPPDQADKVPAVSKLDETAAPAEGRGPVPFPGPS